MKALPAPRPLYGLDRLAAAPHAAVLVVEGEKAADAAATLFPGMIAVTSSSGAAAASKTDFRDLAGRRVVFWPDHDADGRRYVMEAARHARAAGARQISIVEVPAGFPEKWDVADEPPLGWDRAQLVELLERALQTADPLAGIDPSSGVPHPFRLTDHGVDYYEERRDGEGQYVPVCIGRLEVLAYTRGGDNEDWGRLLRAIDPDGRAHQLAVPMSLLSGDGAALRERLAEVGLVFPIARAKTLLLEYIAKTVPPLRVRCVTRVGWHDGCGCYVLPDRTFGSPSEPVYLQTELAPDNAFKTAGDLAGWQSHVARLCSGSPHLVFAISYAFVPPLARFLNAEGGGFHLRGASSTGKTTALLVAASVWGGGGEKGYIRSWRATANGLEAVALAHNDALLCLDELGEIDGRDAGAAAYMLANGQGKTRARKDGSGRPPARWLTFLLSTGEQSLGDKMAEANRAIHAGQEIRFVDLSADAGVGRGIFEDLHGFGSADELARHLRAATARNYGAPIRAFLDRLCPDVDAAVDQIKQDSKRFVAELVPPGAGGQVQRVAHRFALVAAAGVLACRFGILPWPERVCFDAAARLFRDWVAGRGGLQAAETIRVLRLVRTFIDAHGDHQFGRMDGGPTDRATINRVGFRRETDGGPEFLFLRGAFDEVCPGIALQTITDALREAGCLVMHAGGRTSITVKLPGLGRTRVYCVDYEKLCAAQDGGR
jgi:uncharacterized protein (DUF927 family)